jgi:hypothetical protein
MMPRPGRNGVMSGTTPLIPGSIDIARVMT